MTWARGRRLRFRSGSGSPVGIGGGVARQHGRGIRIGRRTARQGTYSYQADLRCRDSWVLVRQFPHGCEAHLVIPVGDGAVTQDGYGVRIVGPPGSLDFCLNIHPLNASFHSKPPASSLAATRY